MDWVEKIATEVKKLPGVTWVKAQMYDSHATRFTVDGGHDTDIALVVLKHRPKGVWTETLRSNGAPVYFGEAWKIHRSGIDKINLVAEVDRFPHKCPRCGQRAYVGFASVEHEGAAC